MSAGGGTASPALRFRSRVRPSDAEAVRALGEATGFFRPDEVAVAVELVTERLAKGVSSGYHFVFAESGGRMAGYGCFGPIACTVHSWDLYWIVVHPSLQGRGLGRSIMAECERLMAKAGGARVYVETSGREQYASTRFFYEGCGYTRESMLADFYAPGDPKVTYCRVLQD